MRLKSECEDYVLRLQVAVKPPSSIKPHARQAGAAAGRVIVKHIPGETNPADLFTKILTRQPFEKHRKFVLNLPGDTGLEHARRSSVAARGASS